METTIAVTSSWQIHLPKSFRVVLGLKAPGQVRLVSHAEGVTITPVKSRILAMAGKYEAYSKKQKVDLNRVRDLIDYSKA